MWLATERTEHEHDSDGEDIIYCEHKGVETEMSVGRSVVVEGEKKEKKGKKKMRTLRAQVL